MKGTDKNKENAKTKFAQNHLKKFIPLTKNRGLFVCLLQKKETIKEQERTTRNL